MPVSREPLANGKFGLFVHLLDRYKPRVIGVLCNGRRLTNESYSYHDVRAALIRACEGSEETALWLIADAVALAKYGFGYAKPSPAPVAPLVSKGYLIKGETLADHAAKAGIDAKGLFQIFAAYNRNAVRGNDPAFGRGTTAFNRNLADPEHQPNPCVAPLIEGP